MTPLHLLQRSGLLACSLALAACSILPKADPQTVYRLPPASTNASANAATRGDRPALRIATPYASRSVDSERILVLPEGDVVKSYAGARWSDPAPVLVRDRLLEAFQGDGRFGSLSGDQSNIAAAIELTGSLQAFQSEYRNGAPTIVIVYDARMIDTGTRRQLAAQRFSVTQAVDGSQLPNVVSAFGRASDRLAAEVVAWAAGIR
ncbi:ABC-type transport auxiliary lipoprotein family protein [Herbaspirillum sp. NPDC087042]|uniref:ABC-type transport auxiliary lipoprotein family protein n=1 Tax=Herbaspirillum sp. NPDC087042 TaxID=3364004 RepID=UPI00382515E1